MKKLLFFLLASISIQAQTSNGQEQEFETGIKNNGSQTVTSAENLVTKGADGTYGNITPYNLLKEKAFLPTGLLKNGALSINAVNTTYDLSAGTGIITNFDNPDSPTSRIITFPAVIGKTPTYLTASNITYVGIQEIGTTGVGQIIEQSTPFTVDQNHDLIPIGAVIHSNLTNINVVNNITNAANDVGGQFHTFLDKLGAFNVTGNKFTANGANLGLNKSAGSLYKRGSNFINNWKNANEISQPASTYLTFRYRTQLGVEGSDRVNLDPSLYDNAGVLTAVPVNKYTVQAVNMFQSGLARVQYGQTIYNSLAEAEAALPTRAFVEESNIALQAVPRAYIILKNTTTSLLTAADAKIIEAGKFDSFVSGGAALTLDAIISALGYTPANIVSPNFTGTPTAPTATAGTNTTQIATTGFVVANAIPYIGATASVDLGSQTFKTNGNIGIGISPSTSKIHALQNVAEFKFNSGNGLATPSIGVGNTNIGGKFAVLIAGTGGSSFIFDESGYFSINSEPKANYNANTLGGGTNLKFHLLDNGLATLPSVTNALISAESTGKAVVTKEYVNATFAPATGSANYIQNRTTQQTANLNISGSGVFGSSVTANGTVRLNSGNELAFNRPDNGAASGILMNASNQLVFTSPAGATFSSSVTAGSYISNGIIRLKNYTVSTLPAGVQGDTALVTDAMAPTYLVAVVGGGSVVTPVMYNGTNWVAH